MKNIIFLISFAGLFFSCNKSDGIDCSSATVTLTAPSCKGTGVIIEGSKYPADDLPSEFAVEGKPVCIEYSFWYDPALCVCCGGKKVHIISIR